MAILPFDERAPRAVFEFLESRVAARGEAHWRWKYRFASGERPAAFYWQDEEGCILGFIGLMRTALESAGSSEPAAWFVDWHVAPQGGVGVGLGLLRKAEADAGMLLTLQGSDDTRKILPRLGWKQVEAASTWVRALSGRFAAAAMGRRLPAGLRGAASLGAPAASVLLRLSSPPPLPGVRLEPVERFPAEYAEVWRARLVELGPAMRRDADYLNYLCADYPGGGYTAAVLRCDGTLAGHLIWRLDDDRHGSRRGRIVDLLWPRARSELLPWLLRTACADLRRRGADYVDLVLSSSTLRRAAAQCGFRSRSPVTLWYHRLPADSSDPARWHISYLDCDRAYR